MPDTQYGLTNAESIRSFLTFWPDFQESFLDAWNELSKVEPLIFADKSFGFSWCHLYELSIHEHIAILITAQSEDVEILDVFNTLKASSDQISIVPQLTKQIDTVFDEWDAPNKDEARELMPTLGAYFGVALSIYNSLTCVLYYGCFLNDLIKLGKAGNDKAFFNAIRIDPTVIGCKSFVNRISKAVLLQEDNFLKNLRNSLLGKHGSLEQANLQKMRLVIEILNEAKAKSLSDEKLYHLFVTVLNLYAWNDREGGNAKALRKFVYTYMNKNSTP